MRGGKGAYPSNDEQFSDITRGMPCQRIPQSDCGYQRSTTFKGGSRRSLRLALNGFSQSAQGAEVREHFDRYENGE
jgi:hypothetical protein